MIGVMIIEYCRSDYVTCRKSISKMSSIRMEVEAGTDYFLLIEIRRRKFLLEGMICCDTQITNFGNIRDDEETSAAK